MVMSDLSRFQNVKLPFHRIPTPGDKILIDASALLLVIPQTDKSEINNPDAEPDAELVRGLLS